jgi:hypothetical protein
MVLPSADFVPRTRNWSPGLIAVIELSVASENRTESPE